LYNNNCQELTNKPNSMNSNKFNRTLRSLAVTTLALLSSPLLKSQDTPIVSPVRNTLSLSLEAGPSFSKFGRDAEYSGFRAGFVGGAGLTYSTNSWFAFTGKLLYHQKGNSYDINGLNSQFRVDYIEIPLLARFFLNKEGRFRPNLYIGPTFSYLVDHDFSTQFKYVTTPDGARLSDFRTFDFGVAGGIGFNYRIKDDFRILLDARYNYGISDILKSPGIVNNQGISATVGVSFGIFNKRQKASTK